MISKSVENQLQKSLTAARPKHKPIYPFLPLVRVETALEGVDVVVAALAVSLLPCDAVCDNDSIPVIKLVVPLDLAVELEVEVEVDVGIDSEVGVIGNPSSSVVAGGNVLMSGAGSVISSISALALYAQKQVGVSVGMKLPTAPLSP